MDKNRDIAADLLRRLEEPEPDVTVKTELAEYVRISVRDIRGTCLANPTHPLSRVHLRAVHDLEDEAVQVMDRLDLLGLLHNREVISEPVRPGVYKKRLGEEYPAGSPVKEPPPSLREETMQDEDPEPGSTSPADELSGRAALE